ncbi:MAG: TonB-dependent receptor plug domain-containing protein [Myxococcota bacterium]
MDPRFTGLSSDGPRGAALRAVLLAVVLLAAGGRGRSAQAADPEPEPSPSGPRPRAEARVRALPVADLPGDPTSFSTIIEADDFRGENRSAADLLSNSVGVQVRRFGGPGQESEISIRGSSGQQVVVLLDGVRLNSAQTGSVDLSTIPIALVDRIEVSRGGGSVDVGSDAVGGVVNIVTKRPGAEPATAASFSGGSWETWAGSASHARRFSDGERDITVGYEGFATEGDWDFKTAEVRTDVATLPSRSEQRTNNDGESHAALLRLGQALPWGWRLTLTDQAFYGSRGEPGQSIDGFQREDARQRRTRNVASARLERDDWLEGALRTELRLHHRYERVRYRDPDPPSPALPVDSRDINQSAGGLAFAEWETGTGWLDHLASARAELRRDDLDSRQLDNRDRWVTGVVVQDELSLWDDRVAFVPALRFDYTEGEGTEWLPRLGGRFSPFEWLRVKGNVEKSYRVPNFDDCCFDLGSVRGNPNLKPEKSFDWDVGVELGLADLGPVKRVRLEVIYFDRDIDNTIVFQQVSPDVVAATNTGDASVDGVELTASVDLLGWLELGFNYTWQDSDIEGGEGDFVISAGGGARALPGRADEEWSLRAALGPPSGMWKLAAEQHYVSSIPLSASGNARVPSRTTYDASLTLDLVQLAPWSWPTGPESLLVSVVGSNLSDESVYDSIGFPQPPRSLTFKGEVRW